MAGGRRRRRMRRFKREKGVSSEEVERKRRARALTGVNDGSAYLCAHILCLFVVI